MEVKIKVVLGGYKVVTLPIESVEPLILKVSEVSGRRGRDLEEALRIIRNFDYFYDLSKRKFKDYLIIPHDPKDMITENVIVDKVKLEYINSKKHVIIVFDKRLPIEVISKALESLNFKPTIEFTT